MTRNMSGLRSAIGIVILGGGILFVARAAAPPPVAPVAPPSPIPAAAAAALSDFNAHPEKLMAHANELAAKTHGNWNMLSSVDQHLLDGVTGGHGPSMFKMLALDMAKGHRVVASHQK